MTTPTGPDRDRLRASDAGQETPLDRQYRFAKARIDQTPVAYGGRARLQLPAPQQPPVSLSQQRRLDVQQPPAQERECTCVPHPYGAGIERDCPVHGEPSEADSAGEDDRLGVHARAINLGMQGNATATELLDLVNDAVRHGAALAASSGVRGGDDQARERLAAVLVLCDELEGLGLEVFAGRIRRAAGGQP